MEEMTRRRMLKSMAVAGASAGITAQPCAQIANERDGEEKKLDRQRVIACGMTEVS